jgi:CDGSH-type Zn-finger protein
MEERVVITPYANGPLIVRGPFTLVDEDGHEIDPGRRTIALCRCGRSRLRPFCDGTHTRARYRAEGGLSAAARERHPTFVDAIAGTGDLGGSTAPAAPTSAATAATSSLL